MRYDEKRDWGFDFGGYCGWKWEVEVIKYGIKINYGNGSSG